MKYLLLFFLALTALGLLMQRKAARKARREEQERTRHKGCPRSKHYKRKYSTAKIPKGNGIQTPRRPRGRPRKNPPAQRQETISQKRGPGRPRKNPAPAPAVTALPTAPREIPSAVYPPDPVTGSGRGWAAGKRETALTPDEFLNDPTLKYHVIEEA